ncbi:hypothetical protein NO1_0370 [Candidatus Termititenax aidoneus]|uniref:Uncharacterized protein n=1 Tax=Termititenax aidoneus TaxID=2218524 RepID=A0A388T9Z2_TERA1|nr:hypothetical protein NO1_0370 [Candidatus Termititenax aidoneus]
MRYNIDMADLSTEDLIACGVFKYGKDDSGNKKPLPENEQREIIKKIWFWAIMFVLFYAAVCLLALTVQ